MSKLTFECLSDAGCETRTFEPQNLVLAGWTGRDPAAVQEHIDELAAHGVAPPSRTPIYYRCSVELVVQSERIQVLGPDTSGEIEFVLLAFDDGLWVTVGSDQTDRKAEAVGVALSKQLAGKVLARRCWRYDELLAGWDQMRLTSTVTIGGERVVYQDAPLTMIRRPEDLIGGYTQGGPLQPGTVMMSGTPPAIGGIRPATRFEMTLCDKAKGREIRHGYDIDVLDMVS